MARIRTIKPEFPQSESMGRVSRDARLLFIQLWTICDDSGRTRAASRMLASLLFPYDDDASQLIDDWLSELEREHCIVRYRVEGDSYIQVCKWLSHQKIDHPSQSKIPPFDESSRILAKPREPSGEDQGSRIKDQGEEGSAETAAPARVSRKSVELKTWIDSLDGKDAIPADDPIFDYASKAGIPLDFLELSWKRFCEDMTERKTRKVDWRAHYRNAVRGNWYKIWWFSPDGDCQLTTVGKQAQRTAA